MKINTLTDAQAIRPTIEDVKEDRTNTKKIGANTGDAARTVAERLQHSHMDRTRTNASTPTLPLISTLNTKDKVTGIRIKARDVTAP
jgi:hypothetical protein